MLCYALKCCCCKPQLLRIRFSKSNGRMTIDNRQTRLCKEIVVLSGFSQKGKQSQDFKAAEVKPHLPLWRSSRLPYSVRSSAIMPIGRGNRVAIFIETDIDVAC